MQRCSEFIDKIPKRLFNDRSRSRTRFGVGFREIARGLLVARSLRGRKGSWPTCRQRQRRESGISVTIAAPEFVNIVADWKGPKGEGGEEGSDAEGKKQRVTVVFLERSGPR